MCAPCGAKNATLSLSMILFAMLSFMYTVFLCLFLTCLCSTLLNNVKV